MSFLNGMIPNGMRNSAKSANPIRDQFLAPLGKESLKVVSKKYGALGGGDVGIDILADVIHKDKNAHARKKRRENKEMAQIDSPYLSVFGKPCDPIEQPLLCRANTTPAPDALSFKELMRRKKDMERMKEERINDMNDALIAYGVMRRAEGRDPLEDLSVDQVANIYNDYKSSQQEKEYIEFELGDYGGPSLFAPGGMDIPVWAFVAEVEEPLDIESKYIEDKMANELYNIYTSSRIGDSGNSKLMVGDSRSHLSGNSMEALESTITTTTSDMFNGVSSKIDHGREDTTSSKSENDDRKNERKRENERKKEKKLQKRESRK